MVQNMAKTKQMILKILYENQDRFMSGQRISEAIGCSRTAVWKQMKSLRQDGYRIEAVQKSGYRLVSAPEGLSEAALSAKLETERIGRKILFFETIGSTQKQALKAADEGAPDGTIVVTNDQSAGRGRIGNGWTSERGKNATMSLILRPPLPIRKTPQLTLVAAVAAVETIEAQAGVRCGIKWPNDLLYRGKKLVGILTELQAEATFVKSVVIGIGFNVNADPETFPAEVAQRATSLKAITGRSLDLTTFVQVFLKKFEERYAQYLQEGFKAIKPLWERYAISLGKAIRVRRPGGKVLEGIARGINDEGVLLLEQPDHQITEIYSADVEWS